MSDLNELLDYLAAAIVDRMKAPDAPSVESTKVMYGIFTNYYKVNLDDFWLEMTAVRLEQLSFIKRVVDKYAGTYFVPRSNLSTLLQIDNVKKLRPDSVFVHALSGGKPLLERVFKNQEFWSDLNSHLNAAGTDRVEKEVAEPDLIPASDRVVTLTHNQQLELEEASTEVVEALSKENSVDGDSNLRDQMLGQLRAGREIIRSQFIRVWLLEQAVVSVLNSLIQRYGDRALGIVAKKLLDRLVEYVFGK